MYEWRSGIVPCKMGIIHVFTALGLKIGVLGAAHVEKNEGVG